MNTSRTNENLQQIKLIARSDPGDFFLTQLKFYCSFFNSFNLIKQNFNYLPKKLNIMILSFSCFLYFLSVVVVVLEVALYTYIYYL